MNHCTTPGCGRRCLNPNNVHCVVCQTAELFRDWRYDTPAMKRWRRKNHEAYMPRKGLRSGRATKDADVFAALADGAE